MPSATTHGRRRSWIGSGRTSIVSSRRPCEVNSASISASVAAETKTSPSDRVVERFEVGAAAVARQVDRAARRPAGAGRRTTGRQARARQVGERAGHPQPAERAVAERQRVQRCPHQRMARQQHPRLAQRTHRQVDADRVDAGVAQQTQVVGRPAAGVEDQRVAFGAVGEPADVGDGPLQPQRLLVGRRRARRRPRRWPACARRDPPVPFSSAADSRPGRELGRC